MTSEGATKTDPRVLSFQKLRTIVGLLGITLPVVVLIGDVVIGDATTLRETISDYYDSVMGGVFVGFLFAIAVFLFVYKGYEPDGDSYLPDNVAGNLAAFFAIGVALFPTNSPNVLIHRIHVVSASALFLVLAYFSLRLFTKSKGAMTVQKKTRNLVYIVCGYVMLACILLIIVYSFLLSETSVTTLKPVFWLETLALWAFGVSWFVKGEAILRDKSD